MSARTCALLCLGASALASSLVAQAPFVDASRQWGLDFAHDTGASGDLLFPEIMGSGAALFDYDGDGDLDVYLVQSGPLASTPSTGTTKPGGDRLFRQDRSEGGPRLVDVTERSGIVATGYGIGVAVGDIDDDGHLDLYLTQFGPNQLWHNRGDGTFEDWTERAGVAGTAWSSSATFFDADSDGRLDLYVADYVRYDVTAPPTCYTANTAPEYCGPTAFDPLPDRLYRNLGMGRFEDVSDRSGISAHAGAGLGVAALDVDADADLDLVVANDQMENFLWVNRGDGTFEESGLWWGVALNLQGRPEASMGIAPADLDADGDEDLFITHLNGESSTLYLHDGETFLDRSRASGLAAPTLGRTSFGVAWSDVDDDGLLDLWVANGEVRALESLVARGDPRPYHQPDQLFHNLGDGRFELGVGAESGDSTLSEAGRGVACGDIDGDGDDDLLLSNNQASARLLLDGSSSPTAVTLRLPRLESAVGLTFATLQGTETPLQRRWLRRDASFASASQARLRFVAKDHPSVTISIESAPVGKLRLSRIPPDHDLIVLWPEGSR